VCVSAPKIMSCHPLLPMKWSKLTLTLTLNIGQKLF
jgi:hypothetical protein